MPFIRREGKNCRTILMRFDDIEPLPKQSVKQGKSGGKKIFYTPAAIKKYQEDLFWLAKSQYKGKILEGPVMAIITFKFLLPKSAPKWAKDAVDSDYEVYKDTKPDLTDNLPKPLIDAISPIVMENDSRISRCHGEKIYAKSQGVMVKFIELPNPKMY